MSRARRQEPPAPAARKPAKAFAPGDRVVVTDGLSKGARGIVVERWVDIGDWQMWRIDLPDCRDRAIRADFLEKVAVPVVSKPVRLPVRLPDPAPHDEPVGGAWFEDGGGRARADFLDGGAR